MRDASTMLSVSLCVAFACPVAAQDQTSQQAGQRDKKIAELITSFSEKWGAANGSFNPSTQREPAGAEMLAPAIADLGAAIRRDPKDADAYFQRGRLQWLANDQDEALADLNMAIKLAPKDARAYAVRSILRCEANKDYEAWADEGTARKLDSPWYRHLTSAELERSLLATDRRAELRQAIDRANDRTSDEVRLRIAPSPIDALLAANQAKAIGKKIMMADDLTLTAEELKFVRANPDMFYARVWQDRFARAGQRAGADEILRNLRLKSSKQYRAKIAFALLDANQRKTLLAISRKIRDHGISSLDQGEKTFVQLYGTEFDLP